MLENLVKWSMNPPDMGLYKFHFKQEPHNFTVERVIKAEIMGEYGERREIVEVSQVFMRKSGKLYLGMVSHSRMVFGGSRQRPGNLHIDLPVPYDESLLHQKLSEAKFCKSLESGNLLSTDDQKLSYIRFNTRLYTLLERKQELENERKSIMSYFWMGSHLGDTLRLSTLMALVGGAASHYTKEIPVWLASLIGAVAGAAFVAVHDMRVMPLVGNIYDRMGNNYNLMNAEGVFVKKQIELAKGNTKI